MRKSRFEAGRALPRDLHYEYRCFDDPSMLTDIWAEFNAVRY
jgi:hypothetical protein